MERPVRRGLVLLVLTVTLVYLPALRGPYFMDDAGSIPGNATIERLWPPSVALKPPPHTTVSGRPVVNYSLALNHAANRLFGANETTESGRTRDLIGFHLVNLLLHLACGMLLFGVVRRTLRSPRLQDEWAASAEVIALAVTAIWLL